MSCSKTVFNWDRNKLRFNLYFLPLPNRYGYVKVIWLFSTTRRFSRRVNWAPQVYSGLKVKSPPSLRASFLQIDRPRPWDSYFQSRELVRTLFRPFSTLLELKRFSYWASSIPCPWSITLIKNAFFPSIWFCSSACTMICELRGENLREFEIRLFRICCTRCLSTRQSGSSDSKLVNVIWMPWAEAMAWNKSMVGRITSAHNFWSFRLGSNWSCWRRLLSKLLLMWLITN